MSKRKLLLADDSVTIQKVVNLTFADEGIDVITVGDGDSAMAKISESAPDVILADVHMPGLSGYQVCEMVRANETTRNLPVVLLVGSFEPFDETEAARVGANAFLTKPFQSIRQLVSQVSDLMRAAAPAAEPVSEEPFAATSEYAAAEEDIDKTIPTRAPDTTDIDSLYSQSVGGRPAEADVETGPPTYLDAGMDDEMIDTVHSGGDSADEEPAEDFYQEPTAEYQQPTDEHQLETAGYHEPVAENEQAGEQYQQPVAEFEQPGEQYQQPVAEVEQPGEQYQQTVAEFEQPHEQYQQPVAEFEQPHEQYQQPVAEFEQPGEQYQQPVAEFEQPEEQYQQPAVAFDQPGEQYQAPVDEYREPAVERHEATAAYEHQAETVFEEEAPRAASPFDAPAEETPLEFESTDQYSEPLSMEDLSTAPTAEFDLDDSDLLELPPVAGQTIEFRTRPGADGGKEVVSLSPELMDALVEKVVKQLSKKE